MIRYDISTFLVNFPRKCKPGMINHAYAYAYGCNLHKYFSTYAKVNEYLHIFLGNCVLRYMNVNHNHLINRFSW